ncbi:MAG TPA: TadE/TadG family type IV pilus assembly protein [Methylobacterium sp.]
MRTARHLAKFAAAREGIAAVEFALLAPALILLFAGCVELSHFASNLRKVGFLTRAVGEVASQGETIDERGAQEIFEAASLILPPFDGSAAKIRLSTIGAATRGGRSEAKVCSAAATANTEPRSAGEDMTQLFPDEDDGSRFLYVEVEMPYRIFFVGQILSPETKGGDSFQIRKALKWPVRKGVRKKSRYPEVVLPIGAACT